MEAPLIAKKRKWGEIFRAITNILRNPKFILASVLVGFIIFFSGLIIDFIVAALTNGYNIIRDVISDLGSRSYTPLPFLFNYGLMLAVLFFIPTIFYANRRFSLFPTHHHHFSRARRVREFLSAAGFVLTVVGLLGLFGVGLFYEGSTPQFHLHNIFASFAFVGFISAGVAYGLLILFFRTPVPRAIGAYMISIPVLFSILFLADVSPSQLFEWLMLFSILGWVLPCGFIFLKQLEHGIRIPPEQ